MSRRTTTGLLLAGLCLAGSGCMTAAPYAHAPHFAPAALPPDGAVPHELCKVVLPPYVIEAPDILMIQVFQPPTEDDKAGLRGDPEKGIVAKPPNPFYKSLDPQPIDGQFVVAMDGTVLLGIYGTVQVAGLTKDQARERVRAFISDVRKIRPDALQVVVDVIAYNSKPYYIITDGAGYGEQIYPFPVTGSETVLDALGRINGLPQVSSKKYVWVARRSPHGGAEQILPVDYIGITQHGIASTNWQVLPGDRVYVQSQPIIGLQNTLTKYLAPVEKVLGVTLLGATTVQTIKGNDQ